ncbi:uncharacterized protein [Littorina saxatilis]|uniref:uncharacterized protein isoform X1 n=1 Tax=Littorina saxatilis TaxID=31220 RepID=UPI0038B44078
MATKRFASHTGEEIETKKKLLTPANTNKATDVAVKTLRSYLAETGQEVSFEMFPDEHLNQVLAHFYIDARNETGGHYKSTTLSSLRYGISRFLKEKKNIDILRDSSFKGANVSFGTAMRELKQMGKGEITHYPEINGDDLQKMYNHMLFSSDTPHGLANKVQMDIRLYFCRRGEENMTKMSKKTFKIMEDEFGRKFVTKVEDELMKNRRQNDKEIFSGIMPEIPGSLLCPVKTFDKYIKKLHPGCERLWQRPRDSFGAQDQVWFYNAPIGKHKLATFMSDLSEKCDLSERYTNHSIRTSTITMLARANFPAGHIMAVSGHKSVSSLAQYQRVSNRDKGHMAHCLSAAIHGNNPALQQPKQNRPSATVTSSEAPGDMFAESDLHTRSLPSTRAASLTAAEHQLPLPVRSLPSTRAASLTAAEHQLPLPVRSLPSTRAASLTAAEHQPLLVRDDDIISQEIGGVDLDELFGEFDLPPTTPVHLVSQQQQQNQAQPFIFNNCSFSNVQFVMRK